MRLSRRDSLWFGSAMIVLGLLVAVFGHLRSTARLAKTTGVITDASVLPGDIVSGPRLLHYDYTVAGAKFSGQGWLRYSARQNDVLQVGNAISVFYDRS